MTGSRNSGPSGFSNSRAGSAAREIQKRRIQKPYKTEMARFKQTKKKVKYHTSYKKPPHGYTFLPVGTQDLATRCKELSRQRECPVHVVNAKPVHRHAQDPEKLSHHVHRIGYHFKTEIVAQACEDLGYVFSHNRFITEAELQRQEQQTKLDRILARHNMHMKPPQKQESEEQVRATIRELFPRIPDNDLQHVIDWGWKEGSKHVGLNEDLPLSRRAQLATIASIRHRYTDYDTLLKAFDYRSAREIVEQDSLRKLIEWRGEHERDGDDEGLEEMVEAIIIDDSDAEDGRLVDGSEADDEDSEMDTSDASVEFTHEVAAAEDLRPESVDESSRSLLRRYQPRHRSVEARQQNNYIAKQKISAVRQQIRDDPRPLPVRVNVDQTGQVPNTIEVDGQIYYREPAPPQQPQLSPYVQTPYQQHNPYISSYATQHNNTLYPPYQPRYSNDYPVQSIEREGTYATAPTYPPGPYQAPRQYHQPMPFEPVRQEPSRSHHGVIDLTRSPNHLQLPRSGGDVVDLTTPERRYIQPVHGAPAPVQQHPYYYQR